MMIKAKIGYVFRSSIVLSLMLGCGVEVGNPTGKNGGSSGSGGKLSIFLADSVSSSIKNTALNLLGVSVVRQDADGKEGQPASIGGAYSGKVEGKDLADGQTFSLTQSSDVSSGDYSGLTLDLNQDAPISVQDSEGRERSVPFANRESGFYVPQNFTVKEGEEIQITLHLDLRRSLKRKGDGFEFGPIAHMIRKEDEGVIDGTVSETSITLVCAYLQRRTDFNSGEFKRLPRDRRGPERLMLHDEGGHRDRRSGEALEGRFEAQAPNSFDPSSTEIAFDNDSSCARAFSTTEVTGGAFRLSHLWPGRYTLRYFNGDGTLREDPITRTEVKPGETVKVP